MWRIRIACRCQVVFRRAILSSAASTSACLRAGTRMKMRPPVDLHLGVLETVPPFAQRVGRKPQAGGVFANTHPGPIHGFHMHRPERLERTRAGARAHGIARSLRPLATLPLLPALLFPTRILQGFRMFAGFFLADQMLHPAFECLGRQPVLAAIIRARHCDRSKPR